MPSFQVHCEECRQKLGAEFGDVHQWLDQLFKTYGPRHRRVRHHVAGIEEVRRRRGDQAAEAARLHVVADLKNNKKAGPDASDT